MKNLYLFKNYFFACKNRLILLAFLILSGALLEGIGIGLFYPLIEYVQKGEKIISDDKFKMLFDSMNSLGISPNMLNFILIIFFVIVLRFAVVSTTQIVSAWTYNPIKKLIRDDGLKKIINSPMLYFNSVSSGKIVNTLINEVNSVGFALNLSVQISINFTFLLVYIAGSLFISWELTLMVVVVALIRYRALKPFIKRSRDLGHQRARLIAYLNSYLINIYQGIDVIKSFLTERIEVEKFEKESLVLRENENRVVYNQAASGFLEGVLGTAFICFAIYFAISLFNIKGTSVFVFLFIMSRLAPVATIINENRVKLAEFTSGIVYLKTVFKENGWSTRQWGGKIKAELKDRILFQNVNFKYFDNANFALNDINLNIRKNEKIAIVGESGAGKTTFIRLLLRLYEPSRGDITIDDVKVADIDPESWKKLISVVSQDTFIFDDTVENNIKYGVENCSDKDFWDAARRARADEFINELPDKEKTRLGERGIKLSGGQRQRIAIARAFLRDTPILILDEATSSLDSVTESIIQKALDDLAKNRTMIVIAHRLSTIKNVDRIVVFDKGKIAEIGAREQLLENDSLYKKYHNLQVF